MPYCPKCQKELKGVLIACPECGTYVTSGPDPDQPAPEIKSEKRAPESKHEQNSEVQGVMFESKPQESTAETKAEEPGPQTTPQEPNEALICIATSPSREEAKTLTEILESKGLHPLLKGFLPSDRGPVFQRSLCQVFVRASEAQKAREIIAPYT